jgi:hypothetical protein
MEVEMKIRGLMMDPVTNMPIVVLKDVQGRLSCRFGLACTRLTRLLWRSRRYRLRGR